MSRSGPVPPAAQTTIRGLWLCFWLTAVGMLVWATVGPLPPGGTRLPWFAVVAALPVWFFTRRLAAWVRQVSRHVSTSSDLRAVARWRIALLVLWILSGLGIGTTTTSPLSFRLGLALASVAIVACVWRFGAVMLAVQATGTPEAAPAAPRVATLLPGWTWTVRAAQLGQLVYLLCADPSFSVAGLSATLLISAGTAGTLELLLRFVRSRAVVEFKSMTHD